MTTALSLCTVAALEVVAVVLSVVNSLPRRHWLRLSFSKFFPHTRRRKHT